MEWLEPWSRFDDLDPGRATFFECELSRELSDDHPLFGCPVAALGKRDGTDDVLFQLLDGTGRVAVVHLTFCNRPESPPWPGCEVYPSLDRWATDRMQVDHDEYWRE